MRDDRLHLDTWHLLQIDYAQGQIQSYNRVEFYFSWQLWFGIAPSVFPYMN
jgi:hypothetical protein